MAEIYMNPIDYLSKNHMNNNMIKVVKNPSYNNTDYTYYNNNNNFNIIDPNKYYPETGIVNEYSSNGNYGYSSKNGFYTNNELTESSPEEYDDDYNYDNQNNFFYSSKNISDNYYSHPHNTKKLNPTSSNNNIIYINQNNADSPTYYNIDDLNINGININDQQYPYNSEKKQNMKIINNYELTQIPPTNNITSLNQMTGKISPAYGYNIKKNNLPNNIKIKNITSNTPSNVKTIPIPNNIKKDNFIFDPNKPVYQKVTNKIQPHPSDKIIRNNMPNVTNINTKGHNVKQIQSEPKNTIRNIINIHNNKELEEKNKIIVDNNKPENIIGQTTQEKIAQNGPQDNKEDLSKYVIEITDNNNNQYIDIIPENTFKYRALTQDDYNQIFLKGVGIINLGNTCFINSCLQALIHCKLFMQLFFSKGIQMKEDTTPISYHFLLLCIEMLDVEKRSHINYIDISYFKYIFGKKHPMFNGFAQNDSQEFCRIFLEDLSTELNEAKNKNIYRTLTNTDNKSKIVKDNEFFINFKERENSIINDLFYSQIITSFKCKCGSEIYSFQKIMDFPLLLPENVNQINIKNLLNNYFKSEVVDFEKKCDKCQQILKHNKEMRISRPPEILILSLQRINETTKKKNNCAVAFAEQLNIYEYIDHELGFDKECDYTLFSIINHVGDMDVGHYFTYIKPLGSQNWYEFNDSTVRKIVLQKTVFSYAYALLYIKSKYK